MRKLLLFCRPLQITWSLMNSLLSFKPLCLLICTFLMSEHLLLWVLLHFRLLLPIFKLFTQTLHHHETRCICIHGAAGKTYLKRSVQSNGNLCYSPNTVPVWVSKKVKLFGIFLISVALLNKGFAVMRKKCFFLTSLVRISKRDLNLCISKYLHTHTSKHQLFAEHEGFAAHLNDSLF